MSYKLIALDLDYTLFRTDLTIAESTRRAITDAQDKGVLVVLATGRMLGGVKPVYDSLALCSPLICGGGSIIYNNKFNRLELFSLDPLDAHGIVNLAAAYDIPVHVYVDGKVLYRAETPITDEYLSTFHLIGQITPDLCAMTDIKTPKALILKDVESIDKIAPIAREKFPHLNIVRSKPHYLEFTRKDVTKATALEYIGKLYGIDKSEMIAVGDNEIDESMISYAGLGCAVGNAIESTKSVADYISADCDHDGVGEIIHKFILGD